MLRAILSLLISITALPAQAGIVGTYRVKATEQTLVFEVADNGDFRSTASFGGTYVLVIGGVAYISNGTRAGLVSDYAALIRERGTTPPAPEALTFKLTQSGTVTVGGRRGRAFYPDFGDGPMKQRLFWVISDEPALRPLGLAFAQHYQIGLEIGAPMLPFSVEAMRPLVAPMETGTPLIGFINFELVSVEFRPIPPERLALPATIDSRDELRKRFR